MPYAFSCGGSLPLRVCTRYRHGEGAVFDEFPYHQSILHSAEAVNDDLPGFHEDISGCRTVSELPKAARDYLDFISDFVDVPIKLVGVGPGRDQVIWADGATPLRAVA